MRIIIICLCCIVLGYTDGYTLATAQQLYKEKRYEDAYTIYAYIGMNREAIRPYMQYAAADCLYQQGKYQQALDVLGQTQSGGRQRLQDDIQALQYACYGLQGKREQLSARQKAWYGDYLFTHNRFAESIDWLQAIPDTTTHNHYILGRDYFSIGAWTSANRELQKATSPEADYYRGLTLLQLGYPKEAVRLLSGVGQDDSDYAAHALLQLGQLAQVRGELALRNNYYRQIIHRFPRHLLADDVAWVLGWQLYRDRDYDQAQDIFLHGYLQHPQGDYSDALLFWAGKCALQRNKKDEAAVMWQKTAVQFPGRYYGLRAAELVSINVTTFGTVLTQGVVPESVRQFISEQAYREALADLEQISANMREPDVLATQRAIAQAATDAGAHTAALRALYPLFQRAEKKGYGLVTPQDWYLYFPRAFGGTVTATQKKYVRVPEALVYAIMREESLFDPDIVSAAGASGLMQLMPGTAKLLAVRQKTLWEPDRLTHPETNIDYGVLYLNNLLIRYKDSLPVSVAGYNAGPVATDAWYKRLAEDSDVWIEELTYRETRGYVKKVLRSFYWYRKLYFSNRQ